MAVLSSDLTALVRGQEADPFKWLGAHVDDRRGRVVVRLLRPGAESADLLLRHPFEARLPMARQHPNGLFEVEIPELATLEGGIDYRFHVRFEQSGEAVLDDPYRFGRVITDYDLHLFGEGTLREVYDRLGAHPMSLGGVNGVHYAVWAPNAQRVSVIGDFNAWDGRMHPMRRLLPSGVWELFVPDQGEGERYKFEVRTRAGHLLHKIDPYARFFEVPPRSAAIVCKTSDYVWDDADWMRRRTEERSWFERPMSIYEVHLASWKRVPEDGNRSLTS